MKLVVVTKLPPIKSSPSLGPTLPLSNPLNLLPGMYSLSDNFILSPVIELADRK